MNFKAFLNTLSNKSHTLPIAILYLTEGCNLKCVMCSYREAFAEELTIDEIKKLADELEQFGLRHIVYSGGEPLLRKDIVQICEIFCSKKIKQTLLSNGLLLHKRSDEIKNIFDEIIISIDGAKAETHDKIRGVKSHEIILNGIRKVISENHKQKISIRTVIQKQNFRELPEFIELAKSLGVQRISFLPSDVSSSAFGRNGNGTISENDIILNNDEINEFETLVENVIEKYSDDFASGFMSESPEKLRRLVKYFKAVNGKQDYPKNICNAPMVSAVITSTGEVNPCFFLGSQGNIKQRKLKEILNLESFQNTRSKVRNFQEETCRKCVCSINVSGKSALLNQF